MNIISGLHRNGVIQQRAIRESRSLNRMERMIISCTREAALHSGVSKQMLNILEMEGQTDKRLVTEPVRVKAKFAFYESGYEEIPPMPSFLITDSNHPGLPIGGNVCGPTFEEYGMPVPKAPTFEKWVKSGKPNYRGDRKLEKRCQVDL